MGQKFGPKIGKSFEIKNVWEIFFNSNAKVIKVEILEIDGGTWNMHICKAYFSNLKISIEFNCLFSASVQSAAFIESHSYFL